MSTCLVFDARPLNTGIWVILVVVDAPISNDKLEGIVHETPIAAFVVLGVAIYQLLLGQRYQ